MPQQLELQRCFRPFTQTRFQHVGLGQTDGDTDDAEGVLVEQSPLTVATCQKEGLQTSGPKPKELWRAGCVPLAKQRRAPKRACLYPWFTRTRPSRHEIALAFAFAPKLRLGLALVQVIVGLEPALLALALGLLRVLALERVLGRGLALALVLGLGLALNIGLVLILDQVWQWRSYWHSAWHWHAY